MPPSTIGFKINLYYPCFTNKVVNDNQMNVVYHVDDIKVSHRSIKIVTRVVKWLKKTDAKLFQFGNINMNIYRGKIHKYLGTTLDFSGPG